MTKPDEVLRAENLSKTFGKTKVLWNVDLTIKKGEVHGLVGHNGSGKSTLIKLLSGFHEPDPGARVFLDGQPSQLGHLTSEAQDRAVPVSFVHQDLGLVLELDTIDNLALGGGYIRNKWGSIDRRAQESFARSILARFDVSFDLRKPMAECTPVERTIVAIASALHAWRDEVGVLVLDEPTAALPPGEVDRLMNLLRDLKRSGAGILYVSHRLEEIHDIADRVTVLRGGHLVATSEVASLGQKELVDLMLGTDSAHIARRPEAPASDAPIVLEVQGLTGRYLRGVDFSLAAGEVLGIAGLPTDGRDELIELLAGLQTAGTGRVKTPDGASVSLKRWRRGRVAVVPAERIRHGAVGPMTVGENLTLSSLSNFAGPKGIRMDAERRSNARVIAEFDIVCRSSSDSILNLSGGNQQKVVFARALSTKPEVLILSEPTAGVDIGSRRSLHTLVTERARRGLGVIASSSDVEDLEAMCTRVLILRRGVIVQELTGAQIAHKQLVSAMEGLSVEE